MRLLLKIQVLYASLFFAENGQALFRHNLPRPHAGWIPRRKQTYAEILALKIPKGGSDNEEKEDDATLENKGEPTRTSSDYDEEGNIRRSVVKSSDNGNSTGSSEGLQVPDGLHGDKNEENGEVGNQFDDESQIHDDVDIIPFESDDDETSDVEIIPFDDDDDEESKSDETSNVEIISFDDDDETKNVEIIPFNDEDEESKSDETSNVEIIPFDDDDETNNVDIIPFNDEDEECGTIDDQPLDDGRKEDISLGENVDEKCQELRDEEETTVADAKGAETNATAIPESIDINDGLSMTSISKTQTNTKTFPTLRWRILDLLQTWKKQDSQESPSSIKHLMHERAEEYIQELLEFEREYKVAVVQNTSLPSLSKAAPHPKKFLRYVAPKIQTIKASPQITLQICSAQPGDVSISICAIGIVSCLTDLYSIIMEDLKAIGGGKKSNLDVVTTKKEIVADRRFEQLLECASCGVDIKRRVMDYNERYSYSDLIVNKINVDERQDSTDPTDDDDNEAVIDSDLIEAQQQESMSLSDTSRFMLGLLALRVEKDATVGSHNATSCIIAVITRSTEVLLSGYKKMVLDETQRSLLVDDIVEILRVLFLTRETFDVDFDPTIHLCFELLGEDILVTSADDDREIDSIVDRLALSEGESINEYENTNSTQKAVNATSISGDPNGETSTDVPLRLVDQLSRRQQISILKCFMGTMELKGHPNDIALLLLNKIVDQLKEDVIKLKEILDVDGSDSHEIECVDAAILLVSKSDSENQVEDFEVNTTGTDPITSNSNETSQEICEGQNVSESIKEDLSGIKPDETSCVSAHIDASITTNAERARDILATTIYDCSVITKIASSIDVELASSILAPCLQVIEALGIESLCEMEEVDVTNLISGIAKIASTSQIEAASAQIIEMIIRQSLQRDGGSFSLREVSHLLQSIATLVSTQSSPIINELVNEEYINEFIEHAMQRMKCSSSTSVWDLVNLAWSYVECNKLCTKSSCNDFEMLGRIAAAVSKVLSKEYLYNVEMEVAAENEHAYIRKVDQSIFCKLPFALSSLDLDSDELNQAVLYHFQENPKLLSQCNVLDHVRLLYSIAKSKPPAEHSLPPETDKVVKECITFVFKESRSEILSPNNFALMLWSFGKLCGEKVLTSFPTNIPVYTREELATLSSTMSLRLVS